MTVLPLLPARGAGFLGAGAAPPQRCRPEEALGQHSARASGSLFVLVTPPWAPGPLLSSDPGVVQTAKYTPEAPISASTPGGRPARWGICTHDRMQLA